MFQLFENQIDQMQFVGFEIIKKVKRMLSKFCLNALDPF